MPLIVSAAQETVTIVAGRNPINIPKQDILELRIQPPNNDVDSYGLWIVTKSGTRFRLKLAKALEQLQGAAQKISTTLGGDLKIVSA